MAIISEIQTKYGIVCYYTKIRQVSLDKDTLDVVLDSYASSESREEEKHPIVTNKYRMFIRDLLSLNEQPGMNIIKLAYSKLIEISNIFTSDNPDEDADLYKDNIYINKVGFPFIGDE